ncbi:hypothetical protein ES708_09206 [subsurface metagenome]
MVNSKVAKDLTIRIMGDPSNLKNALDTAGGRVSKFSDRVTAMGKAAVIAGGIVMAAFGKAFLSFADYEQALIDMAKVTDEPFDKIEAKLKGLDPILGTSKELMKGYYQVISAGVTDPIRALDTLTISAQLAKSAHVDQSEVVKGLTKIMAGYEGAVESATEAADLLYAIERYGQVAVSELIPIIGGLAKTSHTLGINQREMAAAIALGSQTAGSAAEAGTQYQAILTGLMKPTDAMTKAIEWMGFKTAEAAIKELGFVGVLKKLQEATGGESDALAELFGRKEAMLGFTALGAVGFTKLEENIRGVEAGAGAADEAFFRWSESSQASITGLQNRFRDFIKNVGRVLEEDINNMLDKVSEIIDAIDNWMETYPDLFSAIVKGTAKLAAWGVALGTVAVVFGKVSKAALRLWGVITSPFMAAIEAIGLLQLSIKNFGEETPKWLSGLYDSFNKWWDKIVENTDNKWILAADAVKRGLYKISDYTYLILDPLVDYIREGWNKDYDLTVYWWNKIASWMYKGLDALVTYISDNWYKISYTASYWWEQITLGISQTWDRIVEIFTTPLLVDTIKDIWNDILADAKRIWTDILDTITGFWTKIKEIFTGKEKDEIITGSKEAGEETGKAFVTGLEDTISPRIKKTMDDLAGGMKESGENIIEELSKGIESGNPRIKKAMESLTEEVAKPVRSRSPIRYGELKNLFDWGVNIPAELGEGIVAGGDALGKIMLTIAEKNVKEPLLSVFGTILPMVEEEAGKIKGAVEGATKPVFVPVTGLEKVLYDLRILEKQYEEIPKDADYFTKKTKLLNEENDILSGKLKETTEKFGAESAEVKQATIMLIDNENATKRMNKALEEFNKVQELELAGLELVRAKMELLELRYEEIERDAGYYKEKLELLREEHELLVGSLDDVIKKYGEGSEEHYKLLAAIVACENGMKRWWKEIDEGKETVDEFAQSFADKMLKMKVAIEGFKPPDIDPWKEFFDGIKDRYSDTIGTIQTGILNFVSTAENALGDALYNILSGAESFGDSMRGLFESIVNAVIKELARLAAFYVFKWIFGVPTLKTGGGIGYHQFGGEVKKFQIGGGTDSVLAAVTPGEYIIDKPMTDFIKRFRMFPSNLIEAIAGGFPTPAPAFATGGPVGAPNITASGFGETKIYIDIHDNRIADDVDIKRLASTVSNEVLRKIELRRRY